MAVVRNGSGGLHGVFRLFVSMRSLNSIYIYSVANPGFNITAMMPAKRSQGRYEDKKWLL